jgi:hydroxypyruvate isomerase
MLGLNTRRGDVSGGENGLSALPGREAEARAAIDEALAYALAIKAKNIHVMAGFASGEAAHETFLSNLDYASAEAAKHNVTILIEPLNRYDAPGYFLTTTTQAKMIINDVGAANLRLMFDCYHVQLMEGDLTHRLRDLRPLIGNIQFASVPDREAPDHGEIDYTHIFAVIEKTGWDAPTGAEYKPVGPTIETLDWLTWAKAQVSAIG